MRAFGGIRTRGLPLRRRMPYPLGHEGVCSLSWGRTNVHGSKDRCPAIRRSGIVAYGLPVRRWPQACSVLSAISRMVWESNPLPAFAGTFLAERRLDRPFGPPPLPDASRRTSTTRARQAKPMSRHTAAPSASRQCGWCRIRTCGTRVCSGFRGRWIRPLSQPSKARPVKHAGGVFKPVRVGVSAVIVPRCGR